MSSVNDDLAKLLRRAGVPLMPRIRVGARVMLMHKDQRYAGHLAYLDAGWIAIEAGHIKHHFRLCEVGPIAEIDDEALEATDETPEQRLDS